MGRVLKELARKELPPNKIFNNRFVVEMCETMHVHYRNTRILLDKLNWQKIATGLRDSLLRWQKMGEPAEGGHIELCRKEIHPPCDEEIKISLNDNLYLKYEGQVFSYGNELEDKQYIHFKVRDIRIEMSIEEFEILAQTVFDANIELKNLKRDLVCQA